jgi:hypothetical protein
MKKKGSKEEPVGEMGQDVILLYREDIKVLFRAMQEKEIRLMNENARLKKKLKELKK